MKRNLEPTRQYWQEAREFASLHRDYLSWSGKRKQDWLWNERILPSKYDQLPPLESIDIIGLFFTSMRTKMDRLTDEAPPDWKKAIHAHGSVAKIKFSAAADTPFTGIFRGADFGLLRLSVTGDPSARGVAPGLAMKFLIDRAESANFSALVSLTGQGNNYNFFANEFSNIVPVVREIGPKLINLMFMRVTRYPTRLSLENLAQTDQFGQRDRAPYAPDQIFLVPDANVQFPPTPPRDFRDDLATLAPGTKLFSVYAVDPRNLSAEWIGKPEYRAQAQRIGEIFTTSEFVCSVYGDRQLFFRHQRFRNR